MRITYLLERADQLWGGVKVVLDDANWLVGRGHEVTVVARSGPPDWMDLDCDFLSIAEYGESDLPPSDVTIGTLFTTVPHALLASSRAAVHFCQGYEGDFTEYARYRPHIEEIYALDGLHHIAISPHIASLLRDRFAIEATVVPQAIDHAANFPAPSPRKLATQVRVGLVGPWRTPGKGIRIGLEACRLAHAAGLDLELVRVSNEDNPSEDDQQLPFPVERHVRVPPSSMGEIYRSLDVLLGPATSPSEGFYLPAVEAMACGIPCVLSDIPCFRGYRDEPGYAEFAAPGDARQFARALFALTIDDDRRRLIREAGIETAARFSREAHGTALERALVRAVSASYAPAFSSRAPSGVSTTT